MRNCISFYNHSQIHVAELYCSGHPLAALA
jgi:hypothetical protein